MWSAFRTLLRGRFFLDLCRLLAFRFLYGLGRRNLHDGDHDHADITRVKNRNAFRNFDVLDLDRIPDIQSTHIHFDEIGQRGRKTGDLQIPFEMLELPPFSKPTGMPAKRRGTSTVSLWSMRIS